MNVATIRVLTANERALRALGETGDGEMPLRFKGVFQDKSPAAAAKIYALLMKMDVYSGERRCRQVGQAIFAWIFPGLQTPAVRGLQFIRMDNRILVMAFVVRTEDGKVEVLHPTQVVERGLDTVFAANLILEITFTAA